MLDACVLVPSVKRDVLLEVAAQGVFRPLWSSQILDETERAIRDIRSKHGSDEEETAGYIARLRTQLAVAFPDALVIGWESMVEIYDLPDPGDRHVVAAAVVGRADMVVTENVKDFPRSKLPNTLFAEPADTFLLDSLDLHEERVIRAVRNVAARTGRKGALLTPPAVAERTDCPQFAAAIEPMLDPT